MTHAENAGAASAPISIRVSLPETTRSGNVRWILESISIYIPLPETTRVVQARVIAVAEFQSTSLIERRQCRTGTACKYETISIHLSISKSNLISAVYLEFIIYFYTINNTFFEPYSLVSFCVLSPYISKYFGFIF